MFMLKIILAIYKQALRVLPAVSKRTVTYQRKGEVGFLKEV